MARRVAGDHVLCFELCLGVAGWNTLRAASIARLSSVSNASGDARWRGSIAMRCSRGECDCVGVAGLARGGAVDSVFSGLRGGGLRPAGEPPGGRWGVVWGAAAACIAGELTSGCVRWGVALVCGCAPGAAGEPDWS